MTAGDSPLRLACGGLVALAAAMGIGRFLYTPVLPMMDAAGLGPSMAGLVASANFAGYLVGALAASLPIFGAAPRVWMLAALAISAVTTGAMAVGGGPWVWLPLRFAGGLASAFVLVMATSLVVRRLQRAGMGGLTALHFAGVGVGIAISALIASPWIVASDRWHEVWMIGGAIATLALIAVWRLVPAQADRSAPAKPEAARRAGLWRLILAYGAMGFGYVITATFLVAILRDAEGGRTAETIVWLVVGLAAAPSVALWSWAGRRFGAIRAYQAAMLIEAAGVGLSALATGVAALSLAAVALGGTFMGLTALGLQEAARRAGGDGRAVMGLMTAAFGLGQMIGPAVAGWLRVETGTYSAPSLIAAVVLVGGAAILIPLASPERR